MYPWDQQNIPQNLTNIFRGCGGTTALLHQPSLRQQFRRLRDKDRPYHPKLQAHAAAKKNGRTIEEFLAKSSVTAFIY